MVYSSYTNLWILRYHSQGYKPYTIAKLLCESDGIRVSRYGIAKFLKVYHTTGSIRWRLGSGQISKITAEIKELVEQQMQQDNETTAYQLHRMINESGYEVSLRTVLRCRTSLGWTFRGSAYILSTNPWCNQGEAPGVGHSARCWRFQRCNLDWWVHGTATKSQKILLSQAWTTAQA